MDLPGSLKYTETHEWVRREADGNLAVGITEHAIEMLGDLVFVGDVKVGAQLAAGDTAGVVESVKAAADLFSPVAGEITAFNEALDGAPEKLKEKPYESWIFKIKPANAADLDGLLDAAAYRKLAEAEEKR